MNIRRREKTSEKVFYTPVFTLKLRRGAVYIFDSGLLLGDAPPEGWASDELVRRFDVPDTVWWREIIVKIREMSLYVVY